LACLAATVATKLAIYVATAPWRTWFGIPHQALVASPWGQAWVGVDTHYYFGIARSSYPHPHGALPTDYAFFPGYPLAIRALAFIHNPYAAGLTISLLSLLAAAIVLFRLICMDYGAEVARWTLVFLFVFPGAYVLSDVMSEALFLLLTVACAYQCRLGRWGLAALLGALAAVTRPVGVLTLFMPAATWLQYAREQRSGRTRIALASGAPIVGLALYAVFNWLRTRDALAFVHVQALYHRHPSGPVVPLAVGFAGSLQASMASGLTALSIVALTLAARRVRSEYWLFGAACVITPLLTGSMLSMGRFLAVAWPVPVSLSLLMERGGAARVALATTLAVVQLFLLGLRACGMVPI
jgi:hypothetical protein